MSKQNRVDLHKSASEPHKIPTEPNIPKYSKNAKIPEIEAIDAALNDFYKREPQAAPVGRKRSVVTLEEEITFLEKENFDLKRRLYTLEERDSERKSSSSLDLQESEEQQAQVELLRKTSQDITHALNEARQTMERMKELENRNRFRNWKMLNTLRKRLDYLKSLRQRNLVNDVSYLQHQIIQFQKQSKKIESQLSEMIYKNMLMLKLFEVKESEVYCAVRSVQSQLLYKNNLAKENESLKNAVTTAGKMIKYCKEKITDGSQQLENMRTTHYEIDQLTARVNAILNMRPKHIKAASNEKNEKNVKRRRITKSSESIKNKITVYRSTATLTDYCGVDKCTKCKNPH